MKAVLYANRAGYHRFSRFVVLLALALSSLAGGPTAAQDVEFTPLLWARQSTALQVVGDQVYMGLDGGGVAIWPTTGLGATERLTAGENLSSNAVTALAAFGEQLWIATDGGGLTRINDPNGEPSYRQYTNNLGSLHLTAVTGALIDGSERVYYGMVDQGIGRINDGLPGQLYNAADDGLIADNIEDLIIYDGDLFVATELGISRFANNLFTDQNDGLTDVAVRAFAIDAAGDLLVGGNGGVFRWDPDGELWADLGYGGSWVVDLAADASGIWALGLTGEGAGALEHFDGIGWASVTLPFPLCNGIAAGAGEIWIGGRWREAAMDPASGLAYLGRRSPSGWDTWTIDASLVLGAHGLSFDGAGGIWIGARQGDALSGRDSARWTNVYQAASADNGWNGMFNHSGGMLAVAADSSGAIWFSQYYSGVVRYEPAAAFAAPADTFRRLNESNTPLGGLWYKRMLTHPDGTVVMVGDWHGVDILTDPNAWDRADRWLALRIAELGGETMGDAEFERADVLWFAVQDVGLVRWDINGEFAGPDDPITWLDTTDDDWYDPVTTFPGSLFNAQAVGSLALANDGSLWAGANGVARFSYNVSNRTATLLEEHREKTNATQTGLISGSVVDVVVDANDDAWVLSDVGLNRIRRSGSVVTIDAYFDLGNYLADPRFGVLYSPRSVTGLPGGPYRQLAVAPDGRRLLVSGDLGASLISVPSYVADSSPSLDTVYLYPNPYPGHGGDGQLKLGGIGADETQDDAAAIEIYNIEGQLIYRQTQVSADDGFWTGENRVGDRVASGIYLVTVTYRGETTTRTLAVVW